MISRMFQETHISSEQCLTGQKISIKLDPEDVYERVNDSRTEFEKETSSSSQLMFAKDDILWVDNTIFNGVPGNWSAWVLDR